MRGPTRSAGRSPAVAAAGAPHDQDPSEINYLFLGGILAADPLEDVDREGEPVTLLLLAFPAPDASENAGRLETASCEVEVPDHVVQSTGEELRVGAIIFVSGQVAGGEAFLPAKSVRPIRPPRRIIGPIEPHSRNRRR